MECQNCGSDRTGKHYQVHIGKYLRETRGGGRTASGVNVTTTTKYYDYLGSEQQWICDQCVHRFIRRQAFGMLVAGILVCVLALAISLPFVVQPFDQPPDVQSAIRSGILLCGFGGAVLSIHGFRIFSRNEKAATKLLIVGILMVILSALVVMLMATMRGYGIASIVAFAIGTAFVMPSISSLRSPKDDNDIFGAEVARRVARGRRLKGDTFWTPTEYAQLKNQNIRFS